MLKPIFSKLAQNPFRYDVWKLVNRKCYFTTQDLHHPMQIISDIDKTYLETDFHSLRDMAKIALESAYHKKTVQGARAYLRTLKWHQDSPFVRDNISPPLHFVSSSPVQLREVLEEKIALDALLCCSNSFKNQVYNLKKGRFSLLRHQIAYKMASLLSLISRFRSTQHMLLIGDDYESDPFIYVLVKSVVQRTCTVEEALQCLESLHVPKDVGREIFKDVAITIRPAHVHVCIRQVRSQNSFNADTRHSVSRDISWFRHYDELAWLSYHQGILTLQGLTEFMQQFYAEESVSVQRLYDGWQEYERWSQRRVEWPQAMASWIEKGGREGVKEGALWQRTFRDLDYQGCELQGKEWVVAFQGWVHGHFQDMPEELPSP